MTLLNSNYLNWLGVIIPVNCQQEQVCEKIYIKLRESDYQLVRDADTNTKSHIKRNKKGQKIHKMPRIALIYLPTPMF